MKKLILLFGIVLLCYSMKAQVVVKEPIKGQDYDIDFNIDEQMDNSYDEWDSKTYTSDNLFEREQKVAWVHGVNYDDNGFPYPVLSLYKYDDSDSIFVKLYDWPAGRVGGNSLEMRFKNASETTSSFYATPVWNDLSAAYFIKFDKNISFREFVRKLKAYDLMTMRLIKRYNPQFDVIFTLKNSTQALEILK